jgi:hypothetical protein
MFTRMFITEFVINHIICQTATVPPDEIIRNLISRDRCAHNKCYFVSEYYRVIL